MARPSKRSWRTLLMVSVLPVVAFFAAAEALSYFYYRWKVLDDFMPIDIADSFGSIPDLFEVRDTPDGPVLFSRYFPTRYYVSDRNYRGKTMVQDKTGKVFRIFSFGGSSTAGSPWGHEASFSRFLEDELNAIKRDGTKVEVVNFGSAGYGSTRALGLVKETIKYQPDLIVFYEGHNEIWDNYVYLDLAKNERAAQLRRLGNQFYSVRVGRRLLERRLVKPPQWVDLLSDNSTSLPEIITGKRGFKTPERRFLAAQFRQNMEEIVRIARAKSIPVLLVSQPSNFFYQPTWFPGAGDDQEARLVEELHALSQATEPEVTRAKTAEILRINPENPVAHYYRGLLEARMGRSRDAREHFLAAIDFDDKPERYTRAYRDIQRDMAAPARGVFFVDAWQIAGEFVGDGLTDGRLFADKMHPMVECNKLIAWSIEKEYFARHEVRPDLFDYGKLVADRVWRNNVDPGFYLKICARYFNVEDPARCVPQMFERYMGMSEGSADKRILRISWEYLLYYGLLTKEHEWLDKSGSIYEGKSLGFVRGIAREPAGEMKP